MIIALLALQRSIKGPINWNNISIWYLAVTHLHSVSNKHKCRRTLCWSSISCHPRQEMIVFKSRSPFPPLHSHEPLPCSLGDFIAAAGPSSPAHSACSQPGSLSAGYVLHLTLDHLLQRRIWTSSGLNPGQRLPYEHSFSDDSSPHGTLWVAWGGRAPPRGGRRAALSSGVSRVWRL